MHTRAHTWAPSHVHGTRTPRLCARRSTPFASTRPPRRTWPTPRAAAGRGGGGGGAGEEEEEEEGLSSLEVLGGLRGVVAKLSPISMTIALDSDAADEAMDVCVPTLVPGATGGADGGGDGGAAGGASGGAAGVVGGPTDGAAGVGSRRGDDLLAGW